MSCNPLNTTHCPADTAVSTNTTSNFTTDAADSVLWNATSGALIYDPDNGALFTITSKGDSPTVQSNFYIFFGVISVIMRAATGRGVVSSILLESDDLDEIDWEFLGANSTHVETNYFGKGDTTSYDRAVYHPLADPQGLFHNYTIVWTVNKLEWLIDNVVIRTFLFGDALGGQNYPQTPENVRLGVWAGGDATNKKGAVEWAGGLVDYEKGPYTMVVKSVYVGDFSTGRGYTYGDGTGSWQSIELVKWVNSQWRTTPTVGLLQSQSESGLARRCFLLEQQLTTESAELRR